jgi:Bacterial SH3 domain
LKSEALKPTLPDGGQEEDLAMMRALIVLSLVGATAYMLIPVSEEREWNAGEKVSTARLDPLPQDPLPQGERKLRSWGSTLKSLGSDGQGRVAAPQPPSISATLKQEALYQPDSAAGNEASQAAPDTGARPVAETAGPAEAVYDAAHVAWVKVVNGAKAHSAASISSPITKFYPPGKELQILGRESGWIELLDPATQERGYVFERYLVAIDGPGPSQAVTQASPELALVKAGSKAPKPQTSRLATKAVQQAVNDVGTARDDGDALSGKKRDRTSRKEERRERKMFRLFGSRNPRGEAWTVGSPR